MGGRDGYAKAEWRVVLQQSLRQDGYWISVFFALYAGAIALVLARRPYSLTLDAVAYLDIAERASRGDFRALINSHWSPLWPALLSLWFRLFPGGAPSAH